MNKTLNFSFIILLIIFALLILFCVWIFVNEMACHNAFLFDLLRVTEYDCIRSDENRDLTKELLWFYGLMACGILVLAMLVRWSIKLAIQRT